MTGTESVEMVVVGVVDGDAKEIELGVHAGLSTGGPNQQIRRRETPPADCALPLVECSQSKIAICQRDRQGSFNAAPRSYFLLQSSNWGAF